MIYRFEPLLKQTLWGGNKIIPFKHLNIPTDNNDNGGLLSSHIGESWEISGVKGSETVVACGPDKGKSLNQLMDEQREALVGHDNYARFGSEFPLLVKFIDAQKDLSIQVHPNDETARRHGYEHGKTEMWYAMASDPGATLYNGLKYDITPEQYKAMVANHTITDALARHEVHEGEVFFIPAGRIHSIGAGCFIAEIQQTCDVTYRIYDFNRRDKDGNLRQLHTHEAAESIDYSVLSDYRTHYEPTANMPQQVVQCEHFTTAVYDLDEPMTIDYSDLDSFVILIGVKGEGTVTVDREATTLRAGDTILLPATTKEVRINGKLKFLETYV